jgi:hypothetical protein
VGATGIEGKEEEYIISVIKKKKGAWRNALKIPLCHNLKGREHFEKKSADGYILKLALKE